MNMLLRGMRGALTFVAPKSMPNPADTLRRAFSPMKSLKLIFSFLRPALLPAALLSLLLAGRWAASAPAPSGGLLGAGKHNGNTQQFFSIF